MNSSNRVCAFFRKKVALLNFVATMLIVALHGLPQGRYSLDISNFPVYYSIMVLCQIGVPLFFFISGLLMYRNCTSIENVIGKLRKRIKTLLIPYLLWNTLFVGIYFILTNWHVTSSMMNMQSAFKTPFDVLVGIINSKFTPLWFVKQLMFYVLLAPVFLLLLRNKVVFLLVFLASIIKAMNYSWNLYDNFWMWLPVYLSGCAMGYYHVYVARNRLRIIIMSAVLISSYLWCYMYIEYLFFFRIVCPLAIWLLVDWVFVDYLGKRFVVKQWMTCTFFIYCTHYFVLNVLQKIATKLFYPTPMALAFIYIFTCLSTVLFLTWISKHLSQYKVYKVFTGGR